ncbi:hypothetical protein, unknown function [Leishmania mexicana MHOM/GT/2001/U1103]|uniref:Uncharacterized protein n=1 Tax=Leishmania mexicana (strain MHOM/GT/2001/U1103) TaxID=929439 RepID=E9APH8_LEIMU|nr:hypothetical protein, unknown function [Leishmania mexicana MHOM/GT/2001/U1103]CBZ24842.1 hypothetical protein, unknown function [Leishmania mexicana MHOM/GT/2001/U1103]
MREACATSREATLPELVRECYSFVAELILGKAAAADIGGYRNVHQTRWQEHRSIAAETVVEAEQCLRQQHQRSPAEHLISQLARLCPLLCSTATEDDPRGDGGTLTLADSVLAPLPSNASSEIVETSPSWESETTASPPNWWDSAADALDALFDAVDMCVDSTAVSPTFTIPALSLPAAALGGQSLSQIEAALTEESCIMAGLLLHREVRPRSGPCYATVVSPVLVVLDLDGTLLRSPLSSISLRAAQVATTAEVRALFVDADFLGAFCEAVTQRGHELAICSLTEGTADQWATCLSVAEAVVCLLSRVLPPIRAYLTSTDDVVCLPRSVAGPGKLYHLQELQQRRNARDEEQRLLRGPIHSQQQLRPTDNTCAEATDDASDSVRTGPSPLPLQTPSLHYDDTVGGLWNQSTLLLPKWLSTDVVLIDDDRENCRMAVAQGYHATPCAETGMSASWYTANPELQVLLGIPASEVVPRNSARSRRTSL